MATQSERKREREIEGDTKFSDTDNGDGVQQ
jgi:hypothetical protein